MRLDGVVSSGLGIAHVFMAQQHYQEQFREILTNTAWPGTLNVTVEGDDLVNYIALRNRAGIDTLDADDDSLAAAKSVDISSIESHRIRGFLRDGVSFGGATAFLAEVGVGDQSVRGAILIPDLTRHFNVIELISGSFLREHFDLSDGDSVWIKLL